MSESDVAAGVCFFISPIGDDASPERKNSNLVLEHILTPAIVPKYAAKVTRADGDTNPGEVTPAIVRAILDARFVVADITGANPNVYYELAIAHAFKKPTIHIAVPNEVPRFDIKDSRVIRYGTIVDDAMRARESITAAVDFALKNPESAVNPVSRTADLKALENSGNPVAAQLEYLSQRIEELDQRLSRAQSHSPATLLRQGASYSQTQSEREQVDLALWARDLSNMAYSLARHPSGTAKTASRGGALTRLADSADLIGARLASGPATSPELAAFRETLSGLDARLRDSTASIRHDDPNP